jgi:phage tail sheath protein FI
MPDYTISAPGVYIEEVPATGPIAGVGTSVAAFIGPALMGPINVPTLVTNWTQYTTLFGNFPILPMKRFYTPYAVRGFFANGGTVAYIVRLGPPPASLNLQDSSKNGGVTTLVVTALQQGVDGNKIQVQVQDAQLVTSAKVQTARASIVSADKNTVVLTNVSDAEQFQPGDFITIDLSTGGTTERAQINQITGTQLNLASNLTNTYTSTDGSPFFVRIADLVKGQTIFRLQNDTGIESGSVISLTQGTTQENHVVRTLSNDFVTLDDVAGLANAFQLSQAAAPVDVTTIEFNLVITQPPAQSPVSETFNNLSMDQRHSRYFGRVITSKLVNVSLPAVPDVHLPPENLPKTIAATSLTGGVDGNAANQYQNALDALKLVHDVNLVCVCMPDQFDASILQEIQNKVVAHCELMGDRFAILDSAQDPPSTGPNSLTAQRAALTSTRGYAALYYPWILVNDPTGPTGNETLLVPPSGHLAGIYARSDSQRGVQKAPANELINGALNLEVVLNDADQGLLNAAGINVLRLFPGQPPVVWGARTIAPQDQIPWRYINVRRLFIFIEQSLVAGLRWAVFEPNDTTLWKKLERTISEFLSRVWASGALFGNKASQAFYVKIDEELNPPSVQALGQIVIEIGIAPVRPAEFVIMRLAMWDGGSQANEG